MTHFGRNLNHYTIFIFYRGLSVPLWLNTCILYTLRLEVSQPICLSERTNYKHTHLFIDRRLDKWYYTGNVVNANVYTAKQCSLPKRNIRYINNRIYEIVREEKQQPYISSSLYSFYLDTFSVHDDTVPPPFRSSNVLRLSMIVVVYWNGSIYCPIKARLNHSRTIANDISQAEFAMPREKEKWCSVCR